MIGTRFDTRADYLDLQAICERKEATTFFQIDRDGKPFETELITYDAWAIDFFLHLGLKIKTKNKGYEAKLYFSDDESIVWARQRAKDPGASVQFKGSFFLRADHQALLDKAVSFFKERNITFHPTRVDIGVLFTLENQHKFYSELFKIDWGPLEDGEDGRIYFGKKQFVGLERKHSRLEVDFYNKKRQVEKKKVDDPSYKDRLLTILKMTTLPDNLTKLDIRIRQKDQMKSILPYFLSVPVNWKAIEEQVFTQCEARVRFPKKMRDLLGFKGRARKKSSI